MFACILEYLGYLSASELVDCVCVGTSVVKSNSVSLLMSVVVGAELVVVFVVVVVVVVVDSVNFVDCMFAATESLDIIAGRIGARIVDDSANGRSVIKSISSIS